MLTNTASAQNHKGLPHFPKEGSNPAVEGTSDNKWGQTRLSLPFLFANALQQLA